MESSRGHGRDPRVGNKLSLFRTVATHVAACLVGVGIAFYSFENRSTPPLGATAHSVVNPVPLHAPTVEIPERPIAAEEARAEVVPPKVSTAPEVLAELSRISSIQGKWSFLENWLRENATKNPSLCENVLSQLPPGPLRSDGFLLFISTLAESTPKMAISVAERALKGDDKHNAMMEIAMIWSGKDPAATQNYSRSEAPSEWKLMFLEASSLENGKRSPRTAAYDILGNNELSAYEKKVAASGIIAGWSLSKATEAVDWISHNVADPGLKQHLLAMAYTNWATQDPSAAAAALKSAPGVANRDAVLAEVASLWSSSSPKEAAQLLNSLVPSAQKDEAFATIAQDWSQFDPESTLSWVKSAQGISENVRKELIETLVPPPPRTK